MAKKNPDKIILENMKTNIKATAYFIETLWILRSRNRFLKKLNEKISAKH